MNRCKSGYCCTKIEKLSVTKGSSSILHDVSFHIHCGQLISIIGRNGTGKTTLLKALLGETKYTGNITFHDHHGNNKKLKIGYVPQKLNLDDNSPTSVYDFFAAYITNIPVFFIKSKSVYNKICEHLSKFNAENLIDKRLCDLSGGELQQVMLSLAMTPIPDILLLDEPVSAIDREGLEIFYKLLTELKVKNDIAIVIISHDFQHVRKYSDRVILLNKTVLKDDSPNIVLSSREFREEFRINFSGGE